MFFLLRTTFWIGLVLLLLPIGTGSDEDAPSIGIVQVYMAAQSTFRDLSGFCDRNPNACEMGGSVVTLVGLKAKQAVRITYDYLNDTETTDSNATQLASAPATQDVIETIVFDEVASGQLLPQINQTMDEPVHSGALTAADKEIPWQINQSGSDNTVVASSGRHQDPFTRVAPSYQVPTSTVPVPRPNPLYIR